MQSAACVCMHRPRDTGCTRGCGAHVESETGSSRLMEADERPMQDLVFDASVSARMATDSGADAADRSATASSACGDATRMSAVVGLAKAGHASSRAQRSSEVTV